MTRRPLTRISAFEALASRLEQKILSGELAPGTQLPGEGAIGAEWGVSRPVVREALALMRERGYLYTVNGSGTYVRHPDVTQVSAALERLMELPDRDTLTVEHLYEARQAIETDAARLAAHRSTTDQRAELRKYLDEMVRHHDDPVRYAAADVGFHVAIARSSGNPLLPALLTPLVRIIVEGVMESHRSPHGVQLGLQGHRMILNEIEANDGAGAGRAMRDHLENSRTVFPPGVLLRSSKAALPRSTRAHPPPQLKPSTPVEMAQHNTE